MGQQALSVLRKRWGTIPTLSSWGVSVHNSATTWTRSTERSQSRSLQIRHTAKLCFVMDILSPTSNVTSDGFLQPLKERMATPHVWRHALDLSPQWVPKRAFSRSFGRAQL